MLLENVWGDTRWLLLSEVAGKGFWNFSDTYRLGWGSVPDTRMNPQNE